MEKAIGKKTLFRVVAPMGVLYVVGFVVTITNDWYRIIPWIDAPIHFLATAFLIFLFLWHLDKHYSHVQYQKSNYLTFLIVIGIAGWGGILWEFIELGYDELRAYFNPDILLVQFGLKDTMGDLFFNILGGIFVVFYVRIRYYIEKKK